MSFATRCPSCRTTFRVVRDQLKVSEGWVRCGRCGDVFCALDTLFELEPSGQTTEESAAAGAMSPPESTKTPLPASVPASLPGKAPPPLTQDEVPSTASLLAQAAGPLPDPGPDKEDADPGPATGPNRTEPAFVPEGPWPASPFREPDAALPPVPSDPPHPAPMASAPLETQSETAKVEPPAHTPWKETARLPLEAPPLGGEESPPGFVLQARRKERLQRPAVRAALWASAVLLALLLALQVVHQRRDRLAHEIPAMRPWLERWCGWAGCTLGPLRRIEDLVLDHSALVESGAGAPHYRLSLMLRNRGDLPLALPAFELTLTDSTGQLVARRVLLPSDFPDAETRLAPRAQLALDLALEVQRRPVGYTVETFYP